MYIAIHLVFCEMIRCCCFELEGFQLHSYSIDNCLMIYKCKCTHLATIEPSSGIREWFAVYPWVPFRISQDGLRLGISMRAAQWVKWKEVMEPHTLPETNSSPLKLGAPWKRRFRTWKPPFLGDMLVLGSLFLLIYSTCIYNWLCLKIMDHNCVG